MKRTLYTLLFLTSIYNSFGQTISQNEKISEFKSDYLDKVGLYKPDTLIIDSLMLIRERYPNVRIVKTYTKNKNEVIYDYFYNGTIQLESTFTYDTLERPIGITKQYSKEGILEYSQDYDNGIWTVYNKKSYPFYDIQHNMKLKADSLISKMYGPEFLKNNTVWSVGGSYIYNENESGNWTDKFKEIPTKFLFRYDVKLDGLHRYDDLIEFELDEKGDFIPNPYEAVFGFENVPNNQKGGFNLTYNKALIKSEELGLLENDTTKAVGLLRWENFKKSELINGQFRFYITIKIKTIENLVPNGRSSRTAKYEVYSFNPWTAEFIEKKKMKSIYSWEKHSGSDTGLIPDND